MTEGRQLRQLWGQVTKDAMRAHELRPLCLGGRGAKGQLQPSAGEGELRNECAKRGTRDAKIWGRREFEIG